MAIPDLDKHGLLPQGCHDCSWDEVRAFFCWNAHRTALLDKAHDFFSQVWAPLNIAAPIWVDGSFTRKKEIPEDIDVVVDLSHLSNAEAMPGLTLWMQRNALNFKSAYSIDFWVRHPLIPNDLTQFFRYAGTKAAAETGLDIKHPKGILRVLP